jgi:hypothetical protein
MARAAEVLTEVERERVFSSPELAIKRLVRILKEADGRRFKGTPALREAGL